MELVSVFVREPFVQVQQHIKLQSQSTVAAALNVSCVSVFVLHLY